MTAARSTYRRRRSRGADSIPRRIAAWFSGDRTNCGTSGAPMFALCFPYRELLGDYWATWAREHPGAAPPPGWEWIADPASPRHPGPRVLERVRLYVAKRAGLA